MLLHKHNARLFSFKCLQLQLQHCSLSTTTNTPPWIHQVFPQSLLQTKQSHATALVHGHLPYSVSISASLILSYASYGRPDTSRRLFEDTLPYSRSAFFWNTLIRAYSIAGLDLGLHIYNRMVREGGVRPDDHTFPFVLKLCSDFSEVRKGMEIHGLVFKLGFDGDVFVGNTLLLFYGGCGDLNDVEKVFDEMGDRDIVSWNTIIGVFAVIGCNTKAIELFREMKLRSGLIPNLVSVGSVLPACAGLEDEVIASEVHISIVMF